MLGTGTSTLFNVSQRFFSSRTLFVCAYCEDGEPVKGISLLIMLCVPLHFLLFQVANVVETIVSRRLHLFRVGQRAQRRALQFDLMAFQNNLSQILQQFIPS